MSEQDGEEMGEVSPNLNIIIKCHSYVGVAIFMSTW